MTMARIGRIAPAMMGLMAASTIAQSPDLSEKPASASTIAAQAAQRASLPKDDGKDAEFASRGFIATRANPVIANKDGTKLYISVGSASNVAELVAYVKARPGQFNFGSSGKGAAAHLAMEAFMAAHGLKMQHVPYKGTQPALTDLIGGQIQLLFDVPLAMVQHVKTGKIKSFGMASDKRLPGYPDINTFAEGGVPFIANTWSMILAPAKTPKDIVARLNAESNKILSSAAVREKLESTGVVPGSGSAEDAAAFLASEIARNAKVIKDAGVKLDN